MGTVSKCYVGIDPGLSGAVAFINAADYKVFDIPTMRKGDGFIKNEINPRALMEILLDNVNGEPVTAIERVNAMPGQGASSTFSLGDSFGACRAALACCRYPYVYIPPFEWKKHFKLSRDKEEARSLAIKMFPLAELHLKKHADRAEALLIAAYMKEKLDHDKTV